MLNALDFALGRDQPSSQGEHKKFLTPKKAIFGAVPTVPALSPILVENKQKKPVLLGWGGGHVPPVPPPPVTGLECIPMNLLGTL